MPGYSFYTAPEELKTFVEQLTQELKVELKDDLVAIILHGSLAMGSFYVPKSDIDLLIVSKFLDRDKRQKVFSILQDYQSRRPYVGSLEVSVILDTDLNKPRHPLPYLVHFGENVSEVQKFEGNDLPTDGDLMAHLMVAKKRGLSLYGPKPADIIGELKWEEYLASVKSDIDWILEGENILTSPFYCILNLCRWVMMQMSREHIVPSKEEGALWALENMPIQNKSMIKEALEAYRADTLVKDEHERRVAGRKWDRETLLRFRDKVKKLLPKDDS